MVDNKSIELLVNENFLYAKVLEYFGVAFYESRKKTLAEVCLENNIDQTQLIEVLESTGNKKKGEFLALNNYPARLMIAYLKHSHQHFVKDHLPSILRRINAIKGEEDADLIHDLKVILPMFIDDFVHHIYEEEDRLFSYISTLESFVSEKTSAIQVQAKINSFSIQEFALHHSNSDGEMSGIRGITKNYDIDTISDLQLKVLYQELDAFDQELAHHAYIENDILFPKAIQLEKRAKELLDETSRMN
jgi:regulator of cell morphogenesis and NO signaling